LKIATWNVNSIRSRLERLLPWLEQHRPDVLCVQELKVTTDAFPSDDLRAVGYHAAVFGQRTYNGVAIVSLSAPAEVACGMGDGVDDPEARLISATIDGVRVFSVYVPNGQVVGSEKFAYKLAWLDRFQTMLQRLSPGEPMVFCGDFNVARDDADVARPEEWADSVLCEPRTRASFARILDWGLADVVRERYPSGGIYSWWDYRQLAFPRGNGLRIDYILATRPLADRCASAAIDRDARKGQKPSDHAPVVAVFSGE
jgi:exodeoxyribonuclease-3